ncbi:hypothetical protein DPSP01_000963 [Paraphaeosphaeria sporulosa]
MCLYRYVYYSNCQHSELIRVSYCDRAKALGHPQRDDRYRREAGADSPPERPPDYTSRQPSYPSSSHHSSATNHQNMSTLAPSQVGVDVAWVDVEPAMPLPPANQIPRSAIAYSNVNIDIPLDSQSSMSMELTRNARLRGRSRVNGDAVATKHPHEKQHILQLDESDIDTVRAASGHFEAAMEAVSPQSNKSVTSPRKPIPSPWKTTQPRAPVFQTDRRKEEREKRKSLQGSASPPKSVRGTGNSVYLTKNSIETVNSDITTIGGPSSPPKLHRRQSKADLQSPVSSSAKSSPHQKATIKIQVSSTRSPRSTVQSHGSASNVQDQGRAPSVAPSAVSNHDTEYYSAHSPVSIVASRTRSRRSSLDTWHTAEDHELEPPPFSLVGADEIGQGAKVSMNQHAPESTQDKPTSQSVSHARSKTESHVAVRNPIRPAVPNLTLRIPAPKPSFKAGSAPSSQSGAPAFPTKSSSRIPRMATTHDASTQVSRLKRAQSAKDLKKFTNSTITRGSHSSEKEGVLNQVASDAVRRGPRDPRDIPLTLTPIAVPTLRHVRTLDSAGQTPIIREDAPLRKRRQPQVNPRLASYLDSIDPSAHPDHTPFTEDMSADENDESSAPSSRKTSASTVKFLNIMARDLEIDEQAKAADEISRRFGLLEHFDEIEAQEKLPTKPGETTDAVQDGEINFSQHANLAKWRRENVPMKGSPATTIANVETREPVIDNADASDEPQKEEQHSRGRSEQHKPQVRPQSASAHSLRSKASSELRATAPEFFPQLQGELQTSAEPAMTTQWLQPFFHNLPFDPFAVDNYGMPWFFYMYPVQMKQWIKSPKKYKTMPRGRKRGDASLSPKNVDHPALSNEAHPRERRKETEQNSKKDTVSPFAAQLDEIARNAATHQNSKAPSPMRRGYMTLPPRSGRPLRNVGNGLYDTFGRGHFRPVCMPIDATAPFPDPVPPSGRKEYAGYAVQHTRDGCGVTEIDRASEWAGKACNTCKPDH